jgi:cysteine desulfurase
MSIIYWDNAASHPMIEGVKTAIWDCPSGNTNSIHQIGRSISKQVQEAEERVKEVLGTTEGKVVWTSGGSEANQLVRQIISQENGQLLTSSIEHQSIRQPNMYTHRDIWKEDCSYDCDNPYSLMTVNNETGQLFNIKDYEDKFSHKVILHSDMVQALGKVDLTKLIDSYDFVSLSAHKIGGPLGIGCLWIRHLEKWDIPFRGTLNTTGIIGFNAALQEIGVNQTQQHLLNLEQCFLEGLNQIGIDYQVNSFNPKIKNKAPGILNIRFSKVNNQDLVLALDEVGVCISTGSACHSKDNKPSYVLAELGLTEQEINESVRFSFSVDNESNEIKQGIELLVQVIKKLLPKKISRFSNLGI